jgi:hypothetical protein
MVNQRRRWVRALLAGALVLVLAGYVTLAETRWARAPVGGDFMKFFASAQLLVQGEDIYSPVPLGGFDFWSDPESAPGRPLHPNLNPPFATVLLAPLGTLDYYTAFMIWTLLGLAAGVLGAYLLGRAVGRGERDPGDTGPGTAGPNGRRPKGSDPGGRDPKGSASGKPEAGGDPVTAGVLWALVLLVYFPTFSALHFGQWTLVPFFFLVLAWLAWRSGRGGTAGLLLGGLAAIKLFFGAFFLLFLARRRWRAAGAFVAAWIFCTALSAAVVGVDTLLAYPSVVSMADWHGASWNASFLGFFSRLLGGGGVEDPLIRASILTPALAGGLSLLALASLFLLPGEEETYEEGRTADDLAFALTIPVMLLASPFGWMYYFPFLLITLAVLWQRSRTWKNPKELRQLLVLAWLLGTVPQTLITVRGIDADPRIVFGWGGAYVYALVLFWVLAWRRARNATA